MSNAGRIAALYETGSPAQAAGTEIDVRGRVLLPGLFDMHAHVADWTAMQHIAGGVTTIRDLGNDNTYLAELVERIDNGTTIGPHIVAAGFIEGTSEFSAKIGIVVSDLDGVKKAIDWYAQRGYPQIKIYNSFRPEWVPEAVRYAHSRGLRVSGHVPAFMRAEDVVRQGFDEIQHMNQVMLNFFVTPKDDTRTLARFSIVTENAYRLDLNSTEVRDFLALLRRGPTVIDPTLVVQEGRFNQRQGEMNPSYASIADHLPLATQRGPAHQFHEPDRTECAALPRFTRQDGRNGRRDAPRGNSAGGRHRRDGRLRAAPRARAVRQGRHPAGGRAENRHLERREIYPHARPARLDLAGKLADLILVEDDPTKDISAIRRINLVMKDGIIFFPSEIHAATGIKPFVTPISLQARKSLPE